MTNRASCGRFGILTLAAAVLAVAGCSSHDPATSAGPAEIPASQQGATVIGESQIQTQATITAVDTAARTVTLRFADGTVQTVVAPADSDLTQRKAGEVVTIDGLERASVQVLPPGSAPLGVSLVRTEAKAAPDETPGRAAGQRTVLVTQVTAVDLDNNTVTLRGANGMQRSLNVNNPENQEKLKTLRTGDLVRFEVIQMAAIHLKPQVGIMSPPGLDFA